MNYLEEQTDGEAMINSIKNGDQPSPRITQVSIAGITSTKQPPLKDKSMWSDQEKRVQKIDRLARSLLIQGLPNDIYSLIDSNKTANDLWDALARHILGFEYGEQDRKAAVLYEYETFKATEGELLLDTYIRYLQNQGDVNDAMGSKKKTICELNIKFLNNLQPEWKQYATMIIQNKNLMDINIDALYNIFKQNQGDVNDAMGLKKKIVVVNSDPLALIAEKTEVSKRKEKVVVSSDSEGSDADDFSELKKITAFDSDQEINANMVFMAQIGKVLLDSETSSSSADDKISKDTLYNGRKGIGFENLGYFEKAKDLRPSIYDDKVISLGYTLMFLMHSDKSLEIEKFKRSRENKIEFAYDYGNLNASYVNEKINFLDDYFQEIINPDFEMIDSLFQQTSSLKPYVSTVISEKIIIDLEDDVMSLLKKEKQT
nr:hypothetical protein [Tanacetum cinerariifolium]